MDITEYRIVLPLTLYELNIASLYTVCVVSKEESGDGEGIEWVVREQRQTEDGEPCFYTHKIIHMERKVPSLVRKLMPRGAFTIHEKTTNSFPRCRTEYSNPGYMKDNYYTIVDTVAIANDRGKLGNVFGLDAEQLSKREVVNIDIINDRIPNSESRFNTDPSSVTFQKANRGPFGANWKEACTPVLCCYKLVKTEFKWFGLQDKIQSLLKKSMRRRYLRFHRLLFSYLDDCHGMTIDDIRQLEEETRLRLNEMTQNCGAPKQT